MSNLPLYIYEQEEWNQMLLLYDSAIKEISTKLEILNNEFKLSHQYNPIEHLSSRLKSPESIARKLRRREREFTVSNIMKYVNDVAGIRIICSFTSDIYRIADAIARQNDISIITIKDYIKQPKDNGYMSYHMIVTVPMPTPLYNMTSPRARGCLYTKVEIQIRTIAMDFWASLEHKIYYKFEGNAPQGIRAELKECADIVAFLDKKMLSINEYVKEFAEKGAVDDILVEEDDVAIVSVNSVDSKNENADAAVDNDYKDSSNKNNNGNEKKHRKWRLGSK